MDGLIAIEITHGTGFRNLVLLAANCIGTFEKERHVLGRYYNCTLFGVEG